MSNIAKSAVEAIREHIEKNGGRITPAELVQAARHDDRLRNHFTWNNGQAADLWRIEEAKKLLRFSVEVIGNSKEPVRVFVSLSTERGEGYRLVTSVTKDEDLYEQMLQDALDDMESFRERYKRIRELSPVLSSMKKASKLLRSKK